MTPDEILKQEFPMDFIELMKNRVVTSFYKYGPWEKNVQLVPLRKCIEERLRKFDQTGNTEWLVDAANYMKAIHDYREELGFHFKATTAAESPGNAGALTYNEIKDMKP